MTLRQGSRPHSGTATKARGVDIPKVGREWPEGGLCRDMDTDAFFPGRHFLPSNIAAIAACHRCPVWRKCRTDFEQLPPGLRGSQIAGRRVYNSHGVPYMPIQLKRHIARVKGN